MNSFSFAGSGSDLSDESSRWMDGCTSLVFTWFTVLVLIMIRPVPVTCSDDGSGPSWNKPLRLLSVYRAPTRLLKSEGRMELGNQLNVGAKSIFSFLNLCLDKNMHMWTAYCLHPWPSTHILLKHFWPDVANILCTLVLYPPLWCWTGTAYCIFRNE